MPGRRTAQVNAGREKFLKAFAKTGNVSAAAEAAQVSRRTPYKWAEEDPAFKEAWDEAEAEAIDRLERAAWERAVEGWDEGHVNNRGELYSVRKYSDQLMVLLLKAHRPERYRERLEHTGPGGKEPVKFTLSIAPPAETPE